MLLLLDDPILVNIINYLSYKDQYNLSLTCKRFNTICIYHTFNHTYEYKEITRIVNSGCGTSILIEWFLEICFNNSFISKIEKDYYRELFVTLKHYTIYNRIYHLNNDNTLKNEINDRLLYLKTIPQFSSLLNNKSITLNDYFTPTLSPHKKYIECNNGVINVELKKFLSFGLYAIKTGISTNNSIYEHTNHDINIVYDYYHKLFGSNTKLYFECIARSFFRYSYNINYNYKCNYNVNNEIIFIRGPKGSGKRSLVSFLKLALNDYVHYKDDEIIDRFEYDNAFIIYINDICMNDKYFSKHYRPLIPKLFYINYIPHTCNSNRYKKSANKYFKHCINKFTIKHIPDDNKIDCNELIKFQKKYSSTLLYILYKTFLSLPNITNHIIS